MRPSSKPSDSDWRIFEIELAVRHAVKRVGDDALDPAPVHAGAVEEQAVGGDEIGHVVLLTRGRFLPPGRAW